MREYILEGCVDSVESAVIATEAGANRLELCSSLVIGGTTPTAAFFEEVQKSCRNRIHVLIRPRFGDFCYTDHEFSIIRQEVRSFRQLGAEGVVIGILTPDGRLDRERMEILMDAAGGMSVTLHRAFDLCADPFAAVEEAASLGIDTILTSGQQNSCLEGKECLRKLTEQSRGRVAIMAGGGVCGAAIRELYPATGITAYHMSGKRSRDSAMVYRRNGVQMGAGGLSEYEIYQTDRGMIREAVSVLHEL
ncbi:MAG: copper homeostasis protein CutC [Lachnospiraceae bacterium]|nr:copper homeostasis protein CutC [Lachnospiraceae bacterium]